MSKLTMSENHFAVDTVV